MVLAPMWLEWRAARRALAAAGAAAQVELVRCGIGLRRFTTPPPPRPALLVCGLAGGLDPELRPGTVVVASSVACEEGEPVDCDPAWVAALRAGARACGQEPVVCPMLTASRLVVGGARQEWARRGFGVADMEAALLASTGAPIASLRVVIDAAGADVSQGWERPARSVIDPRRWQEAAWLARRAPAYAALAGRCVAAAVGRPRPGV
jgi:hypothetical protein